MKTKWLLALLAALAVVLIAFWMLRPGETREVRIEETPETVEVRQMMNEIVQEQQSGGEGP